MIEALLLHVSGWYVLCSMEIASLCIRHLLSLLPSHDFCSLYRLCKAVDDKLAATLEDAQYFILDVQKFQGPELTKRTSGSKGSDLSFLTRNRTSPEETDPFDRFGDSRQIQSFLQETCFSAFSQ